MSEHAEIITVLLADDYPATRAGIRAMLSKHPDIQVVGEAESGNDVEKLVDELCPQILLLDLVMPGPAPSELERRIREEHPEVITLVLTAHDRDAYLANMIDAGVSGYLHKTERAERLAEAIRRAAHGEILFDSEQLKRARDWREGAGKKWESLTRREREILRLLGQGFDNVAIGKKLVVSPKTVAFHVTNILSKLSAKSRHEAVAWLHKHLPDNLE